MSTPEITEGWTFHEPPNARYRHYRYNDSQYVGGKRIVSVTQVLGVLDKPALMHYAANKTIEGACALAGPRTDITVHWHPDELKATLKANGLMHYQQTDQAARRGTGIHKINEAWIKYGTIPKPSEMPPAWRGYLKAWTSWITNEEPEFLESEVIVGSLKHGYAGTRDTVVRTMVPGRGRVLFDLKTSKHVYPTSHFPQLMAYEIAGVECGEEPTDAQAIVRLGVDGTYEIVYSDARPWDFLSVLKTFRSQKGLELRYRKRGKG